MTPLPPDSSSADETSLVETPVPPSRGPSPFAMGTSWPRVELGLWIAGAAFQACARLVRVALGWDHLVLFTATMNSVTGGGMGMLIATPGDLSTWFSSRLFFWPPGWSMIMVPFAAGLGFDIWPVYASEFTVTLIYFGSIYLIFNRLSASLSAAARAFIIAMFCFVTPPSSGYAFANAWGAAAFVLATAIVLPKNGEEPSGTMFFVSGWLITGALWMRYQYGLAIFTIAIVLLVNRHRAAYMPRLAFHAVGIFLSILPFVLWRFPFLSKLQELKLAAFTQFDQRVISTPTLHWSSLARFPSPAGIALAGEQWRGSFLTSLSNGAISGSSSILIMKLASALLTIAAVAGGWMAREELRKRSDHAGLAAFDRFYLIGLIGFALNAIVLCYLSLMQDLGVTHWSFVQVARYHMIGTVFIVFAYAHLLSLPSGLWANLMKGFVLFVFAVLIQYRVPLMADVARSLASGKWHRPLPNSFFDGGGLARYLDDVRDPGRKNVFIYVGTQSNNAMYAASMARYSGYAANIVATPAQLDTATPVNLVLALPRFSPAQMSLQFTDLCAELGPVQVVGEDITVCHGRFLPRSRPKYDDVEFRNGRPVSMYRREKGQ